MTTQLRKGRPADAPALGAICYQAFKSISEQHGFTPDFPDAHGASQMMAMLIGHDGFFDIVAEIDGRIAGSNFLDERNSIAGVGPVTVDPAFQNDGVGRTLMQRAMQRSTERGFAGIRLVQAAYHRRSLALYSAMGFEVRELLACLQGPAIHNTSPGCNVRSATANDIPECNQLCLRVHGHDRGGELADAVTHGAASVVVRGGRITGYATPIAFFGHAVAETNEDMKSLIGAADSFPGAGFLLPARNGELLRWCLTEGLRIAQTMTLMTMGFYKEPEGAWLASVLY